MLRKEIERDAQGPFWNLIELDVVWLSSKHLIVRCRVYDACADSCMGLSCARSCARSAFFCCTVDCAYGRHIAAKKSNTPEELRTRVCTFSVMAGESIQRKETKRSLKKRIYYCCLWGHRQLGREEEPLWGDLELCKYQKRRDNSWERSLLKH
jgi:hypothetical protein